MPSVDRRKDGVLRSGKTGPCKTHLLALGLATISTPVAKCSVPIALTCVAAISLAIWLYLLLARGAFWNLRRFDDDLASHETLSVWPSVVAIVPARNEAPTISAAVASVLNQDYPGEFTLIVVDDHSDDGTAQLAQLAANPTGAGPAPLILSAPPMPPGWTGKLWALNAGVSHAAASAREFLWFTDADVTHAPDALRRLISRASTGHLDLVSRMVLLQAATLPERFLIPAFLFFFLKLYPPRWIADPRSSVAGAAGGCILLRRAVLDRVGGLVAISREVIDDCALARAVKRTGGRIWMGVTRTGTSLRSYRTLAEVRDMIARTAFTQLRHSIPLLLGTFLGLFLTYLAPIALLFAHYPAPRIVALATWLLMSLVFLPTVRFYRLSSLWAPLLPFIALFYTYATCLSAFRYWLGRGAMWKDRSQAPRQV
jgi:hopene-associated glycosyltransferase HpnB